MYAFKKFAVISLASVAVTCAFAQSEPNQTDANQSTAEESDARMNETDKSAPQAASSPHQRKATSTSAAEAPASSEAEPASSSSPHQRQTTKTAAKGSEQDEMLNNCISKHQKADANLSKDQAKRTCMDQMKKSETPAG